jgi:hypothetical protein
MMTAEATLAMRQRTKTRDDSSGQGSSALAGRLRWAPGPPHVPPRWPRIRRARLAGHVARRFRPRPLWLGLLPWCRRFGCWLALLGPTTGTVRPLPPVGLPLAGPVRVAIGLTVSRRERDLDLDDLVPLLVGAVAFGYGEQFAQPPPRILGGGIVHADIMTHTAVVVQQA